MHICLLPGSSVQSDLQGSVEWMWCSRTMWRINRQGMSIVHSTLIRITCLRNRFDCIVLPHPPLRCGRFLHPPFLCGRCFHPPSYVGDVLYPLQCVRWFISPFLCGRCFTPPSLCGRCFIPSFLCGIRGSPLSPSSLSPHQFINFK